MTGTEIKHIQTDVGVPTVSQTTTSTLPHVSSDTTSHLTAQNKNPELVLGLVFLLNLHIVSQ